MPIIRILIFLGGVIIVGGTLFSAIQTLVLPRGAQDRLTRFVFLTLRKLFNLRLHWAKTYIERDRIMAFYAPIGLLSLPPTWLSLILIGYMLMFWAVGFGSWDSSALYQAFRLSGSALFTLGFAASDNLFETFLSFTAAAIGLILIALLIAYLPTMYAAFSRREIAVTLLEVRAGNPPSAAEMILRFNRIHGLQALSEQWRSWEAWFADIEESHTSLPALVFFRSPQSDHSWITAAGTVLDTASLTQSILDMPADPQAALCIRAGYLALRHVADFFNVPYDPDPRPTDPISIQRHEFDAVVKHLTEQGVPTKKNLDQAWRDFSGWRVNYDTVLLALAALTMAPHTPWSSDRSIDFATNKISLLPR